MTLDFDGNEVYFYNLTIVFHFLEPWQVKINHSSQNHNHIIFLRENRINQDNSINYYEMTSFLSGRFPFEPVSDFTERAKKFHNIIVGKAYLSSSDYNLEHELFFLQPIWRVEFIESLRRYVHGAKLVFPIPSQEAKELFVLALSALEWRKNNGSIKLMTDSIGAAYLSACGLASLYDKIEVSLDGIDALGMEIYEYLAKQHNRLHCFTCNTQ